MKIDFTARYRELSRYLEASERPFNQRSAESTAFGQVLGDIAPDKPAPQIQPQTTAVTRPVELPLFQEPPAEVMASLKMNSSMLKPPTLEFVTPEAPKAPVINEDRSQMGVKTPTVVSIRRVDEKGTEISKSFEERVEAVRKLVSEAGEKFGVDPSLSLAVVSRESSFNDKAVSSDGHASKGLFQLLDRTGTDLADKFGLNREYNPFDPEQNVYLGVGYLRRLHDLFSKETELANQSKTTPAANSASLEKLAVAAFNAGEGRVASAQERAKAAGLDPSHYDQIQHYLPETTRDYVARVMEAKGQFSLPILSKTE